MINIVLTTNLNSAMISEHDFLVPTNNILPPDAAVSLTAAKA